jgi:tetratricopeptide (TPR) repeat protein
VPNSLAWPDPPQAQNHAHKGFELAQQGKLKEAEAELRRAVDLAPENSDYLSGLGSVLSTQQRLREAEGYFLKAVKLAPHNLSLRRNLAANQWELGKLQESKALLEVILKSSPGDERALLLLGMVMERLKNYVKAAELLGSVPDLVKQRPESLGALVRTYYQTGDKQKARQTLEILREHPSGPTAAFLGAQMAAEAEDYEIAETLFQSIQTVYPDKAELGYHLALVAYRMGKFSECRQRLMDLDQKGGPQSRAYNLLGWCYLKEGRPKEGLRSLENAIELDPSRESNYLDLALILASHRRLPDALAATKECVRTDPTSYQAHLMKGLIELHMDQYTDAVTSYEKAIELRPSDPEPYRGLAVAQFGAGMTPEALATFEKALNQCPQNALLHQDYGKVLVKLAETGQADAETRAAGLFQKALALDPSLSESHFFLGNLALQQGRITEAVRRLESAAQRQQKSSRVHYALSRAYRRIGRTEEAAKEQEVFLQLKSLEAKSAPGLSALITSNR